MTSLYPNGLDSWPTTHQDNVSEIIHAGTVNDLADSVNKIEAALGIHPAGSVIDLVTRLAVSLNNDGTLKSSAVGGSVILLGAPSGTDDTTAIQNAINTLNAAGGGDVLFGAGTYIATLLSLKSGVRLCGAGRLATILKQKASTTGDFITLSTTLTDTVAIREMTIDGNKANQTASNNGVYINNINPQSSYSLFDPMFRMTEVAVRNCKGAGIYLTGVRGFGSFFRVFAQFNTLQGFFIDSPDHGFIDCYAGSNGASGFHQTAACNMIRFVNCNSFTNGTSIALSTDIGAGFYATGSTDTSFASCKANGNSGHGFQFDNVRRFGTDASCTAGGNGTATAYAGIGAGFWLKTPGKCKLYGQSYTYGTLTAQAYGVWFQSPNGSACDIDIACYDNAVAPFGGSNGSDAPLNQRLALTDSQGGNQAIAYAASVTADPTLGEIVFFGLLTGNITVNNPSQAWTGARLTYIFQQDATGGRTITLGSAHKTSYQPDLTPNAYTVVSFICDRSGNWRDIAKPAASHQDIMLAARSVISEPYFAGLGLGAQVPNSGDIDMSLNALQAGQTATGVIVLVGTTASGLTLGKVALIDKNGNILAVSADLSATLNGISTGLKQFAFTTPYTAPQNMPVYAALLQVGTTPLSIRRGDSNTTESSPVGGGLRPSAVMTGQTDITGTITFSSLGPFYYLGIY